MIDSRTNRIKALSAAGVLSLIIFSLLLLSLRRTNGLNSSLKKEMAISANFDDFSLEHVITEYLENEMKRYSGLGDIYTYANKIRLFKKLRSIKGSSTFDAETSQLYRSLHNQLFGWALHGNKHVEELQRSFKGRGFVICAGGKYVKLAIHAIKIIRLLGCQLPVEVFYNGSEDMNETQHEYLAKMKGVKVVNLQDFLNTKELGLETWDMKPFAMLVSSFSEAILMDADTVFVHNPEDLFKDPGYANTGTVFFYDRTLFGFIGHNQTHWIDSIVPKPLSTFTLNSRIYNRKTNYEQEAGLVLIDKSRRLLGLIATCRLNFPDFKEELHKFTHGDKESFWLGQELVEDPFYFVPVMSGSVGSAGKNDKGEGEVCGKAAHFDRNKRLFWFNDGIVSNKHVAHSDPSNLQYYGIEGKWHFLCVIDEPKPLDEESKSNIYKILGTFERDPLDMGSPQDGQAMFLLGEGS